MDPDANILAQRELAARIVSPSPGDRVADLATDLADLALALDLWMQQGGAPPKSWQRKRRRAARMFPTAEAR